MSGEHPLRVVLEQQGPYAFRIDFEGAAVASLISDEPPPLGAGEGPNPSELLLAGIANCLSASLLFALRKYKNTPGPIRAEISASTERNAQGRLRIPRAKVTIHLAEPAASLERFDRVLAQFEQFCTVTQSVRDGIEVEVDVIDGAGVVHATGASSQAAAG